jgi:radical SAM superfamily enzyme YgiQ (UPF0313 family)
MTLAYEAGCRGLLVGFESIDPEALAQMNKVINLKFGPESYAGLIAKAHSHGLLVVGEIVVGSDSDTLTSLAKTTDFIATSGLDILRLQILQPLPGTDLYARLDGEDRLFFRELPRDWQLVARDFVMGVHYQTKGIEPRQLQEWVVDTGREFYSNKNIARRLATSAARTRGLTIPAMVLVNSLRSRRTYYNFRLSD